jgi:hypothetical protein
MAPGKTEPRGQAGGKNRREHKNKIKKKVLGIHS